MTKDEYLKLIAFLEAREFAGEFDKRYYEELDRWVKFVHEHIMKGEKRLAYDCAFDEENAK